MAVETKMPPSKQIRNFLLVIGGGMLVGLIVVVAMVQYYGPVGYYVAKNVLVSPEVLEKMWHADPGRINDHRVAFTGIEYHFFDKDEQAWHTKNVSLDLYGNFYQLVGGDRSKEGVLEVMRRLFDVTPPASILIRAATDGSTEFQMVGDVFQQVDFAADGDHYRVRIQEEDPLMEWVYFKHEGILQKTRDIMIR